MKAAVYRPPVVRSLLERLRRNLVRKLCLKVLRRRGPYPAFWIMPDDIICREILLNGYYEKELMFGMTSLVKNRSGTVLDVGANIGNHTIFFSRSFGHVIAFEPVPRNCWILKANLHLNSASNVVLVEKALGDRNEFLYLAQDDPKNTNDGLSPLADSRTGSRDRVEVARGDDVLREMMYPAPVTMIKVDVEGFESKVIKGLRETIMQYRPTIFWEAFSSQNALETRAVLEDMGYRNFYYLTTTRFKNKYINKLVNSVGKSVYLVSLDEVLEFDGMTLASADPVR